MKNLLLYLFALMVVIASFSSCNSDDTQPGNTLNVYCASSLTNVIGEINNLFHEKVSVKVNVNLASSGTLARQITQGASADIYISANYKWTDYLDSLGFIVREENLIFAKNKLVLITPINNSINEIDLNESLNLDSLVGNMRLAMGDPSHVPGGIYAKQALQYFQGYSSIKSKIIPAKDIRSALMLVEMREALFGIVYKTDALKSDKVKILGEFPIKAHSPIIYIAGMCKDSDLSKKYLTFLESDNVKSLLMEHGFNNQD